MKAGHDPADPPRGRTRVPAEALAAAWAVAVSLVYAAVTARALMPRLRKMPAGFPAFLAAGLVLFALVSLRKAAFRMAVAAIGLAAAFMVLENGALVPALLAAAVLGACYAVGGAARRLLTGSDGSRAARVAIDVSLGLVAIGSLNLVAGLAGVFFRPVIAGILAGAAATAAARSANRRPAALGREERPRAPRKDSRKRRRREAPEGFPERFFLAAVIGTAALTTLVGALTPEIGFDALNYHLPVLRDWLAAHAIVHLGYWHSNLAHLAETFFVTPMALGGAPAVKLVVWGLGLALAVAAYGLGDELFGPRAGAWSAAILTSTGVVALLSISVRADIVVALLIATAALAFCLAVREERPAGWTTIAGILAGSAVGTKINAAYAVIVMAVTIVLLAARRRLPRESAARGIVAMAALALPWFAMTYAFTGNPVFPFLNGWFRSRFYPPVNAVMTAKMFGIGTTPLAFLRLPFALVFDTRRFGEATRNGEAGAALLLLPLLFAIPRERRNSRVAFLLSIVAAYAIGWGATYQYARYFTAVLPFVAALAAGGAVSLPSPGRRIALAAAGLTVVFELSLVVFAPRPRPLAAWAAALGREARSDYLRRMIPAIDCIDRLNAVTGKGERVATIGGEDLRYYVAAPVDSWVESPPFGAAIAGLSDAALRDRLWGLGDRFVVVRSDWKGKGLADPGFLFRFADPVCDAGGFRTFRLKAPGSDR